MRLHPKIHVLDVCFVLVVALELRGTVSSALTAFNISAGLGPVALVCGSAGSAFYWSGRKANSIARIAAIPAV